MSNYKLTTNLIVDCHSLKKLNGKQKDINFYIDCLRTIQEFKKGIKGDVIIGNMHFFEGDLVLHSEPDRYTTLLVIFDHNLKKYRLLNMDNEFIWDVGDVNTHWGEWVEWWEVELEKLGTKPRTIASATLHGQGEFPPSTLEELCESYKNVMSK
jgi:hypothetical protein